MLLSVQRTMILPYKNLQNELFIVNFSCGELLLQLNRLTEKLQAGHDKCRESQQSSEQRLYKLNICLRPAAGTGGVASLDCLVS